MAAFISESEKNEMQEHRIEMLTIDRRFRLIFWGHVVLTAVFVVMVFLTGVTETKKHEGAAIWYYSMESGILEMVFAVITLVLGIVASAKNRIASTILLAFFGLLIILSFAHVPVTLSIGNVIPGTLGLALTGWQQYQFMRIEALSQYPGYPLFSEASEPAHYDSLYHVSRKQPQEDAMDRVGDLESGRRFSGSRPTGGDVTAESLGITDSPLGTAHAPQGAPLQKAEGVALDTMGETAASGRAEAKPAAHAEVLLDDMSAEGSAKAKQYAPDEAALPTPEEVRARLAAMKQAQKK